MTNDLKNKLQKQLERTQTLTRLNKEYDLKEYRGRWKTFLTSKRAYELADNVEFGASCGCCADAIQYARPYFTDGDFRIYSPGAQIDIGVGNEWGYGIYASSYDVSKFKNPEIERLISQYLADNEPGDWDDDEEE